MPKQSQPFLLCVLFSLTIALLTLFHPVHADDLSQGMELYQAKKYREAVPLLEKAAREGHEEAIRALDRIYADKAPAIDMTDDKPPISEKMSVDTGEPATASTEMKPAPMYEKATVSEDPKEAADRAFMRKVLFLGTAIIIVLIWVIQYFLLRRLRNRNYRRETPQETGTKSGKPGK